MSFGWRGIIGSFEKELCYSAFFNKKWRVAKYGNWFADCMTNIIQSHSRDYLDHNQQQQQQKKSLGKATLSDLIET